MSEAYTIKPELQAEIDQWLAKYPADQKRSAVTSALLLVQEDNGGWLSDACMQAVADYLELAHIEVYEVATFYDMFELSPIGKYKIAVCTNLSCSICGSDEVVEHLKKRLGVSLGETSADGMFTLRGSECLAACGRAPVIQVDNKKYYDNLTIEKLDIILDKLSQGETP